MTDAETEATPEPDDPPPTRQSYTDTIWQGDDDDTSLSSSLPPMPSPLEYTPSPLLGGEFVLGHGDNNDDDASLFSTQSMQDRLHRTLHQRVVTTQRSSPLGLEPTLDVARLVQQVQLLKHTNGELRHNNKLLLAGGHALEAQHEGLVEAHTTAELKLLESQQQASHFQHQLKQARDEFQQAQEEISKLQTEIQQVSKTTTEQQHVAVTRAQTEFQQELSKLQEENAVLLKEKRDMAHVLAETQTLLQQATVECAAASSQQVPSTAHTVGVQTNSSSLGSGDMDVDYMKALISMTNKNNTTSAKEESDNTTFLPIGECLGRIRDATERASLVQEHQEEIARLVSKHETEQKQLCAKLDEEKDALLQDAMTEMNAGYKGLRRRLESDHKDKMEQVKRQHAKEMERLRNEADIAAAAAAESLQVAMAQATSANQRCQRESKRRQALEIRLDELQAEFDEQKRDLANKHATNLSKLGHGWQAERKDLVNMLQRECNSVFDRTKSSSPRSVTTNFFADIELAEKQHSNHSPLSEQGDGAQMQPSTFSELDRTLRETEAMVEKVLMGNNSD